MLLVFLLETRNGAVFVEASSTARITTHVGAQTTAGRERLLRRPPPVQRRLVLAVASYPEPTRPAL